MDGTPRKRRTALRISIRDRTGAQANRPPLQYLGAGLHPIVALGRPAARVPARDWVILAESGWLRRVSLAIWAWPVNSHTVVVRDRPRAEMVPTPDCSTHLGLAPLVAGADPLPSGGLPRCDPSGTQVVGVAAAAREVRLFALGTRQLTRSLKLVRNRVRVIGEPPPRRSLADRVNQANIDDSSEGREDFALDARVKELIHAPQPATVLFIYDVGTRMRLVSLRLESGEFPMVLHDAEAMQGLTRSARGELALSIRQGGQWSIFLIEEPWELGTAPVLVPEELSREGILGLTRSASRSD